MNPLTYDLQHELLRGRVQRRADLTLVDALVAVGGGVDRKEPLVRAWRSERIRE